MLNSPSSSAKPNLRYQKPLAIIKLDIGKDLTIYPNDNIQQVVEDFCIDNDLEDECVEFIVQSILDQLDKKNQKEELKPQPPNFGQRNDYIAESFGSPSQYQAFNYKDIFSQQSEDSNQTTNQSISEKNDQQLASKYESWQQLIKNQQSQKTLHTKTNTQPTFQLKPQKSNPAIFNKLYNEGLEQYKIREEIQKLNLKQKNEDEMQRATFKPNISTKSKQLAEKRGRPAGNQTILSKKSNNQYDSICSFRPQLSPNTQKIMQSKNDRANTPIHQKLYTEGIETERLKQQWALEMFNKDHPFKSPPPKSKSKSPNPSKYQSQQELNKRLHPEQKGRLKQNQPVPQITSKIYSPYNSPRIHKDEVYQKLPNKSNEQVQKRMNNQPQFADQSPIQKEQKKSPEFRQILQMPRDSENYNQSNDWNQQFNAVALKVFKQLDDDQDGLISRYKLNYQQIDMNVLGVVSQVLYELDDERLVLNLDSFKLVCIEKGIQEEMVRLATLPKTSNSYQNLFQ